MPHPLATYLADLAVARASGVAEASAYGALQRLLDAVGAGLKPPVRCIVHPRNRGAGIPDAGLFTADQLPRVAPPPPGLLPLFSADRANAPHPDLAAALPARGVVEAKPVADDVRAVAVSAQVARYADRYGLVLVTTFREFLLVAAPPRPLAGEEETGPDTGRDAGATSVRLLESYSLAADEASFWDLAAHPGQAVARHGEALTEFLWRALTRTAPLCTPADVAALLASYAKEARARTEAADTALLDPVRGALEEALGLQFQGERGNRFFRSTLVQTLFYGVFSAWVLWCREHPPDDKAAHFDWEQARRLLQVPVLLALFEQVSAHSQLRPLGLVEVLDWTAEALNRVDRADFFQAFREADAVQHFYEPFLQAFDPELRKDLGVWYTPPEVVRYMVARVDEALRDDLELPDGLADPRVVVLDPCCGTGAYLVEVLRRIAETLRRRGDAGLVAAEVQRAARERVFGFEILTAPFVIAHLQVGLLLRSLGAPLGEAAGERAGVYLTNALTGWAPPQGEKARLPFVEFERERDAADAVKRDRPILVVLGNPPYNGFAGVALHEEEVASVAAYKQGLQTEWGIKKFNLDDLYVRFFRMAERRIAETTGRGIVCFVSNFSYLGDPSYVVMRRRWTEEFDRMAFDCLNGDSRETGKLTPEGKPDPSVFSTALNREGIRVGTAVALLAKRGGRRRKAAPPTVRFRHFWGVGKRAALLASLDPRVPQPAYAAVQPTAANRFSFRPETVPVAYRSWPKVTDLGAVVPFNGLMEKRGGALIDIDREALAQRMRAYFDRSLDWEAYQALGYGLTEPQARFDPREARKKALRAEKFSPKRIVRYTVRPFDDRWCYYTGVRPVWNEPRPSLWAQCWKGNRFLITRVQSGRAIEGSPMHYTGQLSDNHVMSPHSYAIPLRLRNGNRLDDRGHAALLEALGEAPDAGATVANLSATARRYLGRLGFPDPDTDQNTAELLWFHVLAVGNAPAYLKENADGIHQDWPRIPLPATREALLASAELGRRVAALLDPETPVPGVSTGQLPPLLRGLAAAVRVDGQALDPACDFALTAGWGHAGQGGATMPGRGRTVVRDYDAEERAALEAAGPEAVVLLGERTTDVSLNDRALWRHIPERVWDYTVGGYQVLKKWLSYRELELLGRSLTLDEVKHFADTARRIAALLLLGPELDASYARAQAETAPPDRDG